MEGNAGEPKRAAAAGWTANAEEGVTDRANAEAVVEQAVVAENVEEGEEEAEVGEKVEREKKNAEVGGERLMLCFFLTQVAL